MKLEIDKLEQKLKKATINFFSNDNANQQDYVNYVNARLDYFNLKWKWS